MTLKSSRRNFLSPPLFKIAKRALPSLSETERQALSAGDVWWDRDLFSGDPDWQTLLGTPPAALSVEEQAFQDGPVRDLCRMLNEWEINQTRGNLSRKAWEYLKQQTSYTCLRLEGSPHQAPPGQVEKRIRATWIFGSGGPFSQCRNFGTSPVRAAIRPLESDHTKSRTATNRSRFL